MCVWIHRCIKSRNKTKKVYGLEKDKQTLRNGERSDRDSQTAGGRDIKRQMGNMKSKLSNYLLLLYLSQIC